MASHKFNIPHTPKQGMKIEELEIMFSVDNPELKIRTSEEGFDDCDVTVLKIDKNGLVWMESHSWIKKFFNSELEKYIIQKVDEYKEFIS